MAQFLDGLKQLRDEIARDLLRLALPAKPWIPARADRGEALDVAIVGAGMAGLSAAAALRFQGFERLVCLDKSENGREGPWMTTARMRTLRTHKAATGPALGIPSLTFRAWHDACFGPAAWDALDLIPRDMWMRYLGWYRDVLDLPVRNGAFVSRIDADHEDGLVRLHIAGEEMPLLARHVVLATGIDGMGRPHVPSFVDRVDRRFWAHSSDAIDPANLDGKTVAIVGGGASAMDNAAYALESGARHVHILVRRDALPSIDKFTGTGNAGLTIGYVGLPDAVKWRLMKLGRAAPVPAPRSSVLRVSRHLNVSLRLGCALHGAGAQDGHLLLATAKGDLHVDFLILATGFRSAPSARPEIAAFADRIACWKHRFVPPAGAEDDVLGEMPYLSADFSLSARTPHWRERLARIHCFTGDAVLSHGKLTSGAPALSEAAQRLARGMTAAFLREDHAHQLDAFRDFSAPELLGNEWTKDQIFA